MWNTQHILKKQGVLWIFFYPLLGRMDNEMEFEED